MAWAMAAAASCRGCRCLTCRWTASPSPAISSASSKCASSPRPAGGPPVQLEVVQAGQVRQEAGPLDERADPGQHRRRRARSRCPKTQDLARGRAGSGPSAPAAWWSCRRRSGPSRPTTWPRCDGEVHVATRRRTRRRTPCAARARPAACPRTRRRTDGRRGGGAGGATSDDAATSPSSDQRRPAPAST